MGDLEALLDMGFAKARAEIALKRPGGLNGALEWLEANQDKSLDEVMEDAEDAEETAGNIAALEGGQVARSLVCNECGKRFRNQDLAQYHATKTEHADFSESTEEIAPLTEEEKKAKLEMLRQKLAAKRVNQAVQDKEDAKKNEKIRQKSTRESQDVKEELQRKEQIKEAARKRQEKLDDMEAKRRIKAKIEADKAERKRKAEADKAAREGRAAASSSSAAPAPAPAPTAQEPKKPANHTEARLRLQTKDGNVMKTLPAETTLFEVAQMLESEKGIEVTKFTTTFPRKSYSGPLDFAKTLKEAGFVPSSVLIVE